jgi:hypothetical protein
MLHAIRPDMRGDGIERAGRPFNRGFVYGAYGWWYRMNVRDLFGKVLWDDVAERFAQHYQDYVKSLEGMKKVFDQVRTCAPAHDSKGFVISIDLVQDEEEHWYNVYGRISGEKERYALEFCLFTEWAGFTVDENLLQRMSPQDIVSHLLWEMTFFGYTEEDIIAQKRELEERARICKEHPERCVPLSEVFEELP